MKDPASARGLTRRGLLRGGVAAGSLLAARKPLGAAPGNTAAPDFLDLLRMPDAVTGYPNPKDGVALRRQGSRWQAPGMEVETQAHGAQLAITLAAPASSVERVHLRWRVPVATGGLVLGDAWERSYGDLAWRGLVPDRVMPWYFATFAGQTCHAYGVRTGAGALCFWQLDPQGVSLWLDVTNGGSGVLLGQRVLAAATVVSRAGVPGEGAQRALGAFCRQMCSVPTLPATPVYGFNDWYYAYGKSTAASILADTAYLAGLAQGNTVRPFSIVDDGWNDHARFPDMARLAEEIKRETVRPGIWIRPLLAPAGAPAHLLVPDTRFGDRKERTREPAYDFTIPEARELVLAKVDQAVGWGYELVKHDFSTYDLLGQWGFEMGAQPAQPGWALHDRSRTNAEVMRDLYRSIRERCDTGGKALVLGCNTVGHLGQGLFDMQRTGDDTSGRIWERTRRMGINTLAFRLPQHGTFFVQDADCVGISAEVPWELNRQWLDVLARSGTAVFVSPGAGSRGPEQAAALKAAFALAAQGGSGARPVDWTDETTPQRWAWSHGDRSEARVTYSWCAPDGAWPFPV